MPSCLPEPFGPSREKRNGGAAVSGAAVARRAKRYDIPAAARLAEQSLADDEVGLRTMPFHTDPPS